jgi:hypothetical protein
MSTPRRALVWDSLNTSSLLVAHGLRARGWVVDSLEPPNSPWHGASAFNGARTLVSLAQEEILERALFAHPLDGLFLHGDHQIRWLVARWERLPAEVRRHLPAKGSLEIALSKRRAMELAAGLGVPALPTRRCASPEEVAAALAEVPRGGELVLKGEGGSAGSAVRALAPGQRLAPADYAALTRASPVVLAQRRLRGPKLFVTVVYERGAERAACGHEKLCTWPAAFGVTAVGVTRYVEAVHEYTERIFTALAWHGIANIEFRQDTEDGRWYFMEINPRINCSLGIQAAAGVDVVAAWAAILEGRAGGFPGRGYRSGVRYRWVVPATALALRRPWALPWGALLSRRTGSDWGVLEGMSRVGALRTALWEARHG